MHIMGELAAIGAAASWVVTGLTFAVAGRRVGATKVNTIRIWIALACLMALHGCLYGFLWPDLPAEAWWWLGISGVIGLAIGDQFLYRALVDAGPRVTTLIMAGVPAITALMAWPALQQPIGGWGLVGMAVTLAGIIWVVRQRPHAQGRTYPKPTRGVILAFAAAICQAIGLITSKLGMDDPAQGMSVDPWTASLARIILAAPACTLILLVWLRMNTAERPAPSPIPSTALLITIGAIFGPFLGVGLALVSIDHIDAGIAATLMATSPIMILPFTRLFEKERIGTHAFWGAILAVCGVGILFLMP